MSFDSRDVIWEKIFDVYYDSYWVEILSDNVIGFWQKTDDILLKIRNSELIKEDTQLLEFFDRL